MGVHHLTLLGSINISNLHLHKAEILESGKEQKCLIYNLNVGFNNVKFLIAVTGTDTTNYFVVF